MKTLLDLVWLGNIYYLSSAIVACEIGGIHLVFTIIELVLEKAGLLLFWFDDHNHKKNTGCTPNYSCQSDCKAMLSLLQDLRLWFWLPPPDMPK